MLRRDPVTIELERGARIAVTVQDDDGRPWDHGVVQLKLARSILEDRDLDDDGRVEFEHIGLGSYAVELFGRSGVVQQVQVTENDKTYEVLLRTK